MDVDTHLSMRIRELRKVRDFTLEHLAALSGVSRSMISLIERGETSPTAAVLNKLADALGVTMASLFSDEERSTVEAPLSRFAQQQVWTDPASGYVRRHVSPSGYASPMEIAEVTFPPGESVAFENVVRSVVTHQQIWMLEGEMDVTVGHKTWRLRTGDCLAMVLDQHMAFHNPTRKRSRYAVAITSVPFPLRRT